MKYYNIQRNIQMDSTTVDIVFTIKCEQVPYQPYHNRPYVQHNLK